MAAKSRTPFELKSDLILKADHLAKAASIGGLFCRVSGKYIIYLGAFLI